MNIGIQIILDEGAKKPTKSHALDGGWDLYAKSLELKQTANHAILLIDTGVHMAIPAGWCGILFGRSGLAIKDNLTTRTYGVIDSGYQGSIRVMLEWDPFSALSSLNVRAGDRVAQILFFPVPEVEFTQVCEFPEKTERADGGFGSTGK